MFVFSPGGRGKNVCFTVPQTDTGGLVEKTKAIGRKMIKELGTKAGRNLWEMPYLVLRTSTRINTNFAFLFFLFLIIRLMRINF